MGPLTFIALIASYVGQILLLCTPELLLVGGIRLWLRNQREECSMFKIFDVGIFASASAVDFQMVEESSGRTLVGVQNTPLKENLRDHGQHEQTVTISVNECVCECVLPKKRLVMRYLAPPLCKTDIRSHHVPWLRAGPKTFIFSGKSTKETKESTKLRIPREPKACALLQITFISSYPIRISVFCHCGGTYKARASLFPLHL